MYNYIDMLIVFHSERWNRFVQATVSVEQTTKGVLLESLNKFTVLVS